MDTQQAETKLKNALQGWEQANEALRKLTRQDTEKTIFRALHNVREARHKLAYAHKEFIDAHRWRLGR